VAVCAGIKRDGARCTVVVSGPQDYCYQHDPARAEERRRAASRAGRSKPSRELVSIKRQLQGLADNVLDGSVDRSDASVAGQLLNILLRAVEVERKAKETDELEERLEALERAQQEGGRSKRWGA
jgi:LPS O-antigen subunit length determinant protein (WzzB/FepE family)